MFDGGCRESTIMWWPGTVPAGTECNEPAMTIDILPTVAHLVGAKLPDHKIDGKNILPLVKGEAGAKSPHEAYYFFYGRELQAVRMGKWKLHFPHGYRTLGGRKGGTGGKPVNYDRADIKLSLFNLESDIGEANNVAAENPEVVKRMEQIASKMRDELGDSRLKIKGNGVREPGRIARATK